MTKIQIQTKPMNTIYPTSKSRFFNGIRTHHVQINQTNISRRIFLAKTNAHLSY